MAEEKLEEGDNSRTRISRNDEEDIEGKGSCSRDYWSVGSGARKPMGFLGPAHDESWSAGWHIILLIKAWMESWKRYNKLMDLLRPLVPGISIPGN